MDEMERAEDDFALKKLVDAVENQISEGHPREAGMVLIELTNQGMPAAEAIQRMAEVLAASIAATFDNDQPFDINAYARDLLALTKSG